MHERQTCVACKARSPKTETNYTLISSRHGWRLTRTRCPDGKLLIEWRCPVCWRAFKAAKGEVVPEPKRVDVRRVKPTSGKHAVAPTAADDDAEPTLVEKPKGRRSSRRPPPQRSRGR